MWSTKQFWSIFALGCALTLGSWFVFWWFVMPRGPEYMILSQFIGGFWGLAGAALTLLTALRLTED